MDRDANELTPAYVTLDTYMTMGAFNFVPESLAVNLNCRISQEHRKLLRGIDRLQAGAGRFQGPVSWRSIARSDSELRRRWRRREESGYDDADLFITPTLSTFGLDMAWYSVTYLLYIILIINIQRSPVHPLLDFTTCCHSRLFNINLKQDKWLGITTDNIYNISFIKPISTYFLLCSLTWTKEPEKEIRKRRISNKKVTGWLPILF